MMYRNLLLLASAAALASCGNNDSIRETLGLNHRAPDEYRVYARPPLSVPPEFNLQAPTTAGNARGQEDISGVPASQQAHESILGAHTTQVAPAPGILATSPSAPAAEVHSVSSGSLPSASDSQFLSNAGAMHADRGIRETIEEDNANGVGPKDSTYLLGATKTTDTTVDAKKEADRLAADKAQNKPPTAGDTPVVAPKDKGFLGGIF